MRFEEINDWIHDDKTWCVDMSCPLVNCPRNSVNIRNRNRLHSWAVFKNTDECPIYVMEQEANAERGDGE